jgi:hypothetical protein
LIVSFYLPVACSSSGRERWTGSCELSQGAFAACVDGRNQAQRRGDGLDNKHCVCRRFLVEVEDSIIRY